MSSLIRTLKCLYLAVLIPLFLTLTGCAQVATLVVLSGDKDTKLTVIEPLKHTSLAGSGKYIIDSCVNEVKKVNVCDDVKNQVEYALIDKNTGKQGAVDRDVKLTVLAANKNSSFSRIVADDEDQLNVLVEVFNHETNKSIGKAIITFANNSIADYSLRMMSEPTAIKIVEYLLPETVAKK